VSVETHLVEELGQPRPPIGRFEHHRRAGLESDQDVTELLRVVRHVPVEQLMAILVDGGYLRPSAMNIQTYVHHRPPFDRQPQSLLSSPGGGPTRTLSEMPKSRGVATRSRHLTGLRRDPPQLRRPICDSFIHPCGEQ
jgi:hypothetical protein